MAQKTNNSALSFRQRYFRRSNVYTAEYILMLVMVGSLAALLSSTIFSLFNYFQVDGVAARALQVAAVGQLAALTVVAPAAFWFYSRVSGQEMVQPELRKKTSRSVFLTIWIIGMFVSIVGVSVSVMAALMGALVGVDSGESGGFLVSVVIPGSLVIVLLASIVIMIAHSVSRKLSMAVGIAIAALSVLLFVAMLVVVMVKSGDEPKNNDRCTYSRVVKEDCSYSDYEYELDGYSNYNKRGGGIENIYQPSSGY